MRGALLYVVLSGALASCAQRSPAASDTAGRLSGTVAYRERVALPLDATVTVTLLDVSRQDVTAPVVSQTTIKPAGRQVPLDFELGYDPRVIDRNRSYALRATIWSGGQVLFTTDAVQRVITGGHPTRVDLRLMRAGRRRAAPGAVRGDRDE